jgi:hypothetical protein
MKKEETIETNEPNATYTGNPDKLRDEIISFQNHRKQLVRWKLIGTGGLATFFIQGKGVQGANDILLILALIPLFIAYCDQAICSLEIRIAVIAAFFRKKGKDTCLFSNYEIFLSTDKKVKDSKWWEVISFNDLWSSMIIYVLIVIIGVHKLYIDTHDPNNDTNLSQLPLT